MLQIIFLLAACMLAPSSGWVAPPISSRINRAASSSPTSSSRVICFNFFDDLFNMVNPATKPAPEPEAKTEAAAAKEMPAPHEESYPVSAAKAPPADAAAIHHGKVLWFSKPKGFGFIIPEDGKDDDDNVFVHQTAIHKSGYRSLRKGEAVEFQLKHDDAGRAVAIKVTGPDGVEVKG